MTKMQIFITCDHYMVMEGIHSLRQNEETIQWSMLVIPIPV